MRRVYILCIMMLFWIGGYSQNFYTTNNIVLEEIPETEYRSSYQSKSKSVSKWKNKGRKYKRIVKGFLDSDIARELYISEESAETGKLNIRIKKLKSKRYDESYIIQETATVGSKAYYMKWAIPDTMAMFGIGDIDNEQIYYACPDYDCDQHVWCRWYSFADGRVSIAAELKDTSFEYDFADYDLPSFFADNKGRYYLAINRNPNIYKDVGGKTFYKINWRR